MKISIAIAISFFLLSISTDVNAQNKTLIKDTVYYLVDTSHVPIHDRLFELGKEGDFSYYQLLCKCYPFETDPVFSYVTKRKGTILSEKDIAEIKWSDIQLLITKASRCGIDKTIRTIFYFIEPDNDKFIKRQVYLLPPRKQQVLYNQTNR